MKINTCQFSYNPQTRQFTTEISDLGPRFVFKSVYKDAADEGLTLVSKRTGREVTYVVNHTEFDAEGDLKWWDLIPANPHSLHSACNVAAYVEARHTTLRIFND